MASLAEQLRSLSTPAPCRFDLDEDEFDVTRAQAIDKGDGDGDIESETVSATSDLRKKTAPLLHDVDKKYAGRKVSRAQIEASRSHHVDDSDGEEDCALESDSEGSIIGLGMSEDEDDNDKDVDKSEDQEGTVEKHHSGTMNSKRDGDDDDDRSSGDDNDDDDDGSDTEKDNVHSASDDKSEGDYSAATEDDLDTSVSEDDDDNDDEDLGDDAIQSFSATSLKEDLEKGKAAKNQLSLWDSFLEMRIRLQKALLIGNRLPQKDQLASFNSSGDKNLRESYKQGRKSVAKLLGNLLWIQEKLLEQNPDTRNILHPGAESSKSTAHSSDGDEEIPSDTEDEKSDDDNDDDLEDTDDQPNGKQAESSLKLPAKRKHELATSEYAEYISKRHAAFKSYRDATVSKWSEKTRLASGKLNSKSFSSFDRSALSQINHILSDKARLIKRTQLKRTPYRVLGKLGDNEQTTEPKKEQSDLHLKDYDSEIFDDDDFYHQLLREFIEQRTSGNTGNPIDMGRQWLELQKLRRKVKRKVDTKASKGRKIRYDVHGKLVSFMAPIERGTMADSSRNELFCSLFGAKQQEQAADISVFR